MKKDEGFTFLEMIIAFSIFSILILIIYATFFNEVKRSMENALLITMNIEGNRSMQHIKAIIDQYDEIEVINGSLITSKGIPIIDARDDGGSIGSEINLDYNTHELADMGNQVLGTHVKNIRFEKGPYNDGSIGITKDMLLIIIEFEKDLVSYTIKGGINLVR